MKCDVCGVVAKNELIYVKSLGKLLCKDCYSKWCLKGKVFVCE